MSKLFLDFETASEVDLLEHGLDQYRRHSSTRVLMLAWAFDDAKVKLWQPHLTSELPTELLDGLGDPLVTKVAWNAEFERNIFEHVLGILIPTPEWLDPMVMARQCSMPGKLVDAGRILKLRLDQAKLQDGERLIQLFCVPAKAGGERMLWGIEDTYYRNWESHPEDWKKFGEYGKRDVETIRTILKKLSAFPLAPVVQRGWILDQKINEAGMPVDRQLVTNALAAAERNKAEVMAELAELTGLANANSPQQLMGWLVNQGYQYHALGKAWVVRALAEKDLTPPGRRALELRQQASKTSYTKYEAIKRNIGPDSRLRFQFAYLGASRTGRWTGHDVQLQNLPRPNKELEDRIDLAVQLLHEGGPGMYERIVQEFKSPPMDVVSAAIRASFRAPDGYRLVVADLNAIENRMLGWMAGCDKILDVFRQGKDPYKAFATDFYKVDYDAVSKDQRQMSKPAVLGCGYGLGGGDEMDNMDGDTIRTGLWGYAMNMGIDMPREEAHRAVHIFRDTYPEVIQLWADYEAAAELVLKEGGTVPIGKVIFARAGSKSKAVVKVTLPSGRNLHYVSAKMQERSRTAPSGDTYHNIVFSYEGIGIKTKQWERISTYGGKWTENIDQAISRDILMNALFLADERGFEVIGHCHDEVIAMVPMDSPLGVKDLEECMRTSPEWAPDLPLNAAGFEGVYYRKG